MPVRTLTRKRAKKGRKKARKKKRKRVKKKTEKKRKKKVMLGRMTRISNEMKRIRNLILLIVLQSLG
jgi:hypothetical protein